MKKRQFIKFAVLCAGLALTLTACGLIPNYREQVLSSFETQQELILEKVGKHLAGEEARWDELEGVREVRTYDGGIIKFMCVAEGIVTSSVEAGFYYSPDDEPAYVGWYPNITLAEDGNGWSWSDGTDNRYSTERICENFYYYTESN